MFVIMRCVYFAFVSYFPIQFGQLYVLCMFIGLIYLFFVIKCNKFVGLLWLLGFLYFADICVKP